MNWKLLAALGAAVGGVYWYGRRKREQGSVNAALWAEATDPVVRAD